MIERRVLGKTGISVPAVGFGCGNIGGLMVRGSSGLQLEALRHALGLGIDYFDTAAAYGDGQSETHLGAALAELRAGVRVASKFRLPLEALADTPGAVRASLEATLERLGREFVDVFQLHNVVCTDRGKRSNGVSVADVLGRGGIADALDALKSEGLVRHAGFTGMGDTESVHAVVRSARFDTVQVYFNLLNPSAGHAMPRDYPNQDFGRLIDLAAGQGMGVVVIRVMAGGALGGVEARQGLAANNVGGAMAPGNDYDKDVARARALAGLDFGGLTPPQAAVRFALDHPQVSTVLVGFSSLAHIDSAVAAANAPPLSQATMARLRDLWARDFGSTQPAA